MKRGSWTVLALALAAAACAGAGGERWTRAGADDAAVERDLSECQTIGREQAFRQYPYSAGSAPYGPSGMILSQQQDSTNRASVQASVANECMARKGYAKTAP